MEKIKSIYPYLLLKGIIIMKELEEFKKDISRTIKNKSDQIINAFNKAAKNIFKPEISILYFVVHPEIIDLSIEMVLMTEDYSITDPSEFIIRNLSYLSSTNIVESITFEKNKSEFENAFEKIILEWIESCYNISSLSKLDFKAFFYFTE